MNGLNWGERLRLHEQNAFLRTRGLALADPQMLHGRKLPSGASAWQAGGKVRVISFIVRREHDVGNIAQAIVTGHFLDCEVVLITPNCYVDRVERAIAHAESVLQIGDWPGELTRPTVDVHSTTKFSVGDVAWIVDTAAEGNARQVRVMSADLVEDGSIYSVTDETDGQEWTEVPEAAVHALALGARADVAIFDEVFATALKEEVSFRDALDIVMRRRR
jgi:hypothetical protein